MKTVASILFSLIGTAILSYFTIIQVIDLPQNTTHKYLLILTIAICSILCSILVNIKSFLNLRTSRYETTAAREKYLQLEQRLQPILLRSIEDILRKRVNTLPYPSTQLSDLKTHHDVYVFMKIKGQYRVVASTVDMTEPVRKIALRSNEGIIGFTVERKAALIAKFDAENDGEVFNTFGNSIGFQEVLSPRNLEKIKINLKWVYAEPIFVASPNSPWADDILGIITVDSYSDNGKAHFEVEDFQNKIHTLASDISQHLIALKTLSATSNLA